MKSNFPALQFRQKVRPNALAWIDRKSSREYFQPKIEMLGVFSIIYNLMTGIQLEPKITLSLNRVPISSNQRRQNVAAVFYLPLRKKNSSEQ